VTPVPEQNHVINSPKISEKSGSVIEANLSRKDPSKAASVVGDQMDIEAAAKGDDGENHVVAEENLRAGS